MSIVLTLLRRTDMKPLIQQIIDQIIIKKALMNDYPKPNVIFLGLDNLFKDPVSRKIISQAVHSSINPNGFDAPAGISSRGFIFSGMIANQTEGKGENFVQKVKSFGDPRFVQDGINTEYSADALQVLKGTIQNGKKYLVVDDLLATGGSVKSAIKLIKSCGGQVDTVFVMTELVDLEARESLKKEGITLISLLQFTQKDLKKLLLMQKCYDYTPSTPITYRLDRHARNDKKLINANQSPDLTVHLASKSALKEEATKLACQGLFDPLNVKMIAQNISSGVNDQPFGYDETIKGATNRLKSLVDSTTPNDNSMLISIENGLRYSETEKCYFDFIHVIVKKGQTTFSHTQDCCKVPTEIVNAIGKDKNQAFVETWGQVAKRKGLAKDANNPHQEKDFGGISRVDHLLHALCKVLGQMKNQMMPDNLAEIETQQVNIKRLVSFDSNKSQKNAKRGIFVSAPNNSFISKPINFYNQGAPVQSWNIPSDKISRNKFQIFSTGDAFSIMSPDIDIKDSHINIHVGIENADYSPLVMIHEGLQLCRCAYEHGARSIIVALPEQFHPVLHPNDFNRLLMKLFKTSAANRIFYYDKSYTGKLDDATINAMIPLTIVNQTDETQYQLNRGELLKYLLSFQDPQKSQLSLDDQFMHYTRRYNFDRDWCKFNSELPDSSTFLGGYESSSKLSIPEMKMKPHVLLCCSANKPLANEIASSLRRRGEMVKLYHIQGQGAEAKIPKEVAICGSVVTIIQSTRPNPDHIEGIQKYQKNGASSYFFEAAMIARQARLRGADTINLINPYQFGARSDKAEDNPKGRTGAYVQQNGRLLEAAGVNHVVTAECHDNHTMSGSYTGQKIKGSSVSALSVISTRIAKQWIDSTNGSMKGQLRLVTPDAGAAKRTKELTQQLQAILGKKLSETRILGDKQRDSHKDDSAFINSLNSGSVGINPHDKYLITDDETATGNTLCQAITNLKKDGAKDIEVIIVHNNMPLDWLIRQLCLARFLYLGVNNLHFSDTQEMGTLAKSYGELVQKYAQMATLSNSEVEKQILDWFVKNISVNLSDKTEEHVNQQLNLFKSMFDQFQSKIKIHCLADEFAHEVLTKPYMENPHAFEYKVNEYISKIQNSRAQSIVVFEGVNVAAASAAALALDLPLQVLPDIIPGTVNQKLTLPNNPFALIGTPTELTLTTPHTSSDPEGDLAIIDHKTSSVVPNDTSTPANSIKLNQNIKDLLSKIEMTYQTIKNDIKLKNTPVKLLGIGVEGQHLAGQLSYLLIKKGIYLGIAVADNKQSLHASPVVYSIRSGDQVLSIDRNSLSMGDVCIAVSSDVTKDTKTALHTLAAEAKVRCPYYCSYSEVGNVDSEPANRSTISAATKGDLLFFPGPSNDGNGVTSTPQSANRAVAGR